MQLRSGRRLLAPRQGGGGGLRQRRCRPRRCPEDLICSLPDDILLEILGLFRNNRAAVRTSVLSRRWRLIYTRLPTISFYVAAGNGARFRFDRLRSTKLSIKDDAIGNVVNESGNVVNASGNVVDASDNVVVEATRLTAALRIAAHIAPTKLYLELRHLGLGVPFELPCFEATTTIRVICSDLNFTLPPAGVFAYLEHLDIWNCICDPCHLLDRCPRLRHLMLSGRWSADKPLAVRSASLEELVLRSGFYENGERRKQPVDFATPALRKLHWCGAEEVAVLHSMPMVEDVFMWYRHPAPVGFGNQWALESLNMGMAATSKHEQPPPAGAGRVLSLWIRPERDSPVERSFAQEIAGLPRALNFSVLELKLKTEGHVRGAGALVLEVLKICPVQTLKLRLLDDLVPKCPDTCECDQVSNDTSQQISLAHLEVVQIEWFRCAHHEIDLLKLLFRSAPMLKRMTVQLGDMHDHTVPLDDGQRRELHTIFEANTTVACDVYDTHGEKILLA